MHDLSAAILPPSSNFLQEEVNQTQTFHRCFAHSYRVCCAIARLSLSNSISRVGRNVVVPFSRSLGTRFYVIAY